MLADKRFVISCMNYKISVIIPVYNAESYLSAALESLVEQTFGFVNLQVICVDDCSTDSTPQMLAEYAEKYSNIYIYKTEKNSGAAGTPRNLGLEYAVAPYVMFLDPDDFFDKEACSILFEKIEETGCEIVGGCCCLVDEDGENPRPVFPRQEEAGYACPSHAAQVVKVMSSSMCHIYRNEYLSEHRIRFTPKGHGEDTAFLCKCITQNCDYVYIPRIIHNYRQHKRSITNAISEKYFAENMLSILEIKNSLLNLHDAYEIKLSELGEYYFKKCVQSDNLGDETLQRIYQNYRELFTSSEKYNGSEAYIGLALIEAGMHKAAAKYTLLLRDKQNREYEYEQAILSKEAILCQRGVELKEKDQIVQQQQIMLEEQDQTIEQQQIRIEERDQLIQQQNERFCVRVVEGLKKKQIIEVIKLCFARIMKSHHE